MTTLNSTVTASTYDEVLRLAQVALDEATKRRDRLAPEAERRAKPIGTCRFTRSSWLRSVRLWWRRRASTTWRVRTALAACHCSSVNGTGLAPDQIAGSAAAGGRADRSAEGWYAVLKVNRTTVGVEAGFPWPHKVARTRVLEVRGAV